MREEDPVNKEKSSESYITGAISFNVNVQNISGQFDSHGHLRADNSLDLREWSSLVKDSYNIVSEILPKIETLDEDLARELNKSISKLTLFMVKNEIRVLE